MKTLWLWVASFLMIATLQAAADDTTRSVRFGPGRDGTVIAGRIQGYDTATYLLDVNAGQRLLVSMSASNGQAYFNVTGPGGRSLFVGSVSGDSYSGVARRSGTFRIDVYLMRAAARRDEASRFRLAITVPADGGGAGDDDGDFADGDAGGPDQWIVAGVPAGDRLNVRVAPSAGALTVARLRNGTVVTNRGCQRTNGSRWCRIKAPGVKGWVNGRFLREY